MTAWLLAKVALTFLVLLVVGWVACGLEAKCRWMREQRSDDDE